MRNVESKPSIGICLEPLANAILLIKQFYWPRFVGGEMFLPNRSLHCNFSASRWIDLVDPESKECLEAFPGTAILAFSRISRGIDAPISVSTKGWLLALQF